mmetsp:Transcript_15221/g.34401  ORF Transcript_15221/g.34401 Transcript_15221/m.34401 type:complete len:182 (+) Transcript_15221:623-1168(+)
MVIFGVSRIVWIERYILSTSDSNAIIPSPCALRREKLSSYFNTCIDTQIHASLVYQFEHPKPIWVAYIYFPVLGFVLASLFCVSCQDPGLMERVTDEEAGNGGWFWNEQVGSFRPPGALYCRECGVLIQDYDHLCPWTGTGVGRRNMMAFKLFVVGVNVLCYFSIILVIVALLRGLRVKAE